MKFKIAGIPCIIALVEVIGDYVPAKVNADPDSCYVEEFPDVSFVVLDRKGRPAPWLADKMTDAEAAEASYLLLKELEDDSDD